MKRYLLRRRDSILVAWSGLIRFFNTEAHAAVHMVIAFMVLLLAGFFSASRMEWILLILVIGLVILAEILNTVLEKLIDFIHPETDPRIKIIKDMAASAVLWSAIVAAVTGSIIFIPYLITWLTG